MQNQKLPVDDDDIVLQNQQKAPMSLQYKDDILSDGDSLNILFIGEIVRGSYDSIKM